MQSGKSLALLASIPAVILSVAQAYALPVTFVNQFGGDNANACATPAAPCASISGAGGALAKVDEGGIIHVAPGDYGTFSVGKSVEIVVDGGEASIVATATAFSGGIAGIVVNAGAGDVVRIRGFHFDGATIGSIGVAFVAGGALHLEDCTFVNAGSFGLVFAPSATSELYVSRSAFSGNSFVGADGGIRIRPTGSGSAKVVLENVLVENNFSGITIDGRSTSGSNFVTLRNSVVSGSSTFGIYSLDSGGGTTGVTIEGSTSSSNGQFGVGSNGVNSTVRVRNSTVTGNGTGLAVAGNGKIVSLGGNSVVGNTANGAFTSTVAQQ